MVCTSVIYHKRRARYYTYKSDTELEISLVARRDDLQFFFASFYCNKIWVYSSRSDVQSPRPVNFP